MTEPVEVIREARNILFERGWTQGEMVEPDGRVCLEGALCLAQGLDITNQDERFPLLDRAWKAVGTVLDGKTPFVWNDDQSRTFSDVIDLLDKVEKHLEVRS